MPTQFGYDLEALEMSLKHDSTAQRMRERIVALQQQLRGAIDDQAWSIYLSLEHAVNERTSFVLAKLSPEVIAQARPVSEHIHRRDRSALDVAKRRQRHE